MWRLLVGGAFNFLNPTLTWGLGSASFASFVSSVSYGSPLSGMEFSGMIDFDYSLETFGC